MAELKVVCLLGQGFEDSEFRVPYDRLRSAGIAVDVVGAKAGEELEGYRRKEKIRVDRGIDEVRPEAYAALLIPGGYSPDHLRADQRFVAFVKKFEETGHPIAAVCHGPQLLISAELVRGRTVTAWKTIQGDLRQMGAKVKDEPVVIDRNWITSRQPSDLEDFSRALIETLRKGRDTRAEDRPGEGSEDEEAAKRRPAVAGEELPGMSAEKGIDTENQRLRREAPGRQADGGRSSPGKK